MALKLGTVSFLWTSGGVVKQVVVVQEEDESYSDFWDRFVSELADAQVEDPPD